MCEFWEKRVGYIKYEEWSENHHNQCQANYKGSSGIEVDAIVEMFCLFEELHGVKYFNTTTWVMNIIKHLKAY